MRTHGETKTRLYSIWCNMKNRCNAPNFPKFKDYGGRGIGVCSEWSSSFVAFRNWSLSNGYADHLEIDRRDNDNGYSPQNCRWVSRSVQTHNTRKRRGTSSQFRGVSFHKGNKLWRAQVCLDYKIRNLGYFKTEREAAVAYDVAARQAFGESAKVNFA